MSLSCFHAAPELSQICNNVQILVLGLLEGEVSEGLDVAHGGELVLRQLLGGNALSFIHLRHLLEHVHKHEHVRHFSQAVW